MMASYIQYNVLCKKTLISFTNLDIKFLNLKSQPNHFKGYWKSKRVNINNSQCISLFEINTDTILPDITYCLPGVKSKPQRDPSTYARICKTKESGRSV